MAVTDLTDSLPWWATSGAGGPQGPGATGTPSAAPMGSGGLPGGGDSTSWLNYLSQMFGISPAQAATMMQQQNGQQQQVPPDTHGDGPPGPVSPFAGQPPINNFSNPPPANGPGPGNVGPVPLAASEPSILPQARGQAVPPGPMAASILPQARGVAVPPDPSAASILPQARGVAVPPGPMAPGSTTMAAPPVPGPLATGGATPNPRFVGISAPNMSPQNSMRRGPQGTALNLAGLFGGAGGAPSANPANVPAASAQPVSGPLAKGRPPGGRYINPQPPGGPPDYGMAPIDITGYPVAGVNATRSPDMTSAQLASAVRKPNWWRNV